MREEAYRNLSAKLQGSVITPVSDEYEVARRVYNDRCSVIERNFFKSVPGGADTYVEQAGFQLSSITPTASVISVVEGKPI
jgi:hypothetical protein